MAQQLLTLAPNATLKIVTGTNTQFAIQIFIFDDVARTISATTQLGVAFVAIGATPAATDYSFISDDLSFVSNADDCWVNNPTSQSKYLMVKI